MEEANAWTTASDPVECRQAAANQTDQSCSVVHLITAVSWTEKDDTYGYIPSIILLYIHIWMLTSQMHIGEVAVCQFVTDVTKKKKFCFGYSPFIDSLWLYLSCRVCQYHVTLQRNFQSMNFIQETYRKRSSNCSCKTFLVSCFYYHKNDLQSRSKQVIRGGLSNIIFNDLRRWLLFVPASVNPNKKQKSATSGVQPGLGLDMGRQGIVTASIHTPLLGHSAIDMQAVAAPCSISLRPRCLLFPLAMSSLAYYRSGTQDNKGELERGGRDELLTSHIYIAGP